MVELVEFKLVAIVVRWVEPDQSTRATNQIHLQKLCAMYINMNVSPINQFRVVAAAMAAATVVPVAAATASMWSFENQV